ncbi:Pentapeptide repeat protein [Pandoravirus kuranda]|uniref:Pentapeptide repeat protein n=1 Tax=Pandoravirus kuranda TaxID=3019033 RepID=A0AA95EDL2_9VIRU|nr:Pentapeptide repeat protein [Pandoravirus kuranda]
MSRRCQSKKRAKTGEPHAARQDRRPRNDKDAGNSLCETGLDDLPVEILLHILSAMDTRDVGACAMVSRAFADACDDRALWMRLCDIERAAKLDRVCKAAEAAAQALVICSRRCDWPLTEMDRKTRHMIQALVKDVESALCSAWYAEIDLAAVLGHPRFACAAHARIRVIVGAPFSLSPAGDPPSTQRDYKTVGTLIRCQACNYALPVREARIDSGFFDAVGVMCGPGVSYTFMSTYDRVAMWRGCVSLWRGGSPSADSADLIYVDGIRYRGGVSNGVRHGRGCFYDCHDALIVAGEWKDDKPHGFCSWRAYRDTTSPLVANALFVDGYIAGPVAYFARGRLVAVNHWRMGDRTLGDYMLRCPPLGNVQTERAHGTLVVYTPSGTTVESGTFFVHRWTDGALVAGRISDRGRDGLRKYEPSLFLQGRIAFQIARRCTVDRDPYTLALTLSPLDPADPLSVMLRRDRTDPRANGAHIRADAGHPARNCDARINASCVDAANEKDPHRDFALCHRDFMHIAAAAVRARCGLDDHDALMMDDQERMASAGMLARFDSVSGVRHYADDHKSLCRGRLRGALYVHYDMVQRGLDMTRCVLRDCVFVGAAFEEVDFRGARFEKCLFYRCSFVLCAFYGAAFCGSIFCDCCLAYEVPKGRDLGEQRFDVDTAAARSAMVGLGATFS